MALSFSLVVPFFSCPKQLQAGQAEAGVLWVSVVPGGSGQVCNPATWWPGGSGCGQGGAKLPWLENEHKRTNTEACTMLMRHSPGHRHAVPHHHCLGPGREQRDALRLMAALIAWGSAGFSPLGSPNCQYSWWWGWGRCTSLLD